VTPADEQAARLTAALGTQYRFERELGRGGMGVVYLARDLALDRPVAIKVVHPELTANRTIAARFLAEARTVARLRHPGIVAVHTAGEVDGHLYYVMDYLAGETLRQRLAREGPLPAAVAGRIAAAVAEALDAAAAAGVVHRDLKPENILLEGPPDAPRALLADFGIARLAEGSGVHTGPGAVMGTPAYMSPEQAAGDEVDGRSDLYSLGIVTYEMLAGAPPFAGPHRVVISKQILDPPPPLAATRPDLPAPLVAAVHRALEKTPAARWPTGRDFREALLGLGAGGAVPPPAPARRRGRAGWLGAAALALVAAGVALASGRDGPPAGVNPRQSIMVLPFDNLRQETALDWLRDGAVNMLTLSLSQWRDLAVVDQHRIHDLIEGRDHDDAGPIGLAQARRLARAGGAWTVVLGDFSRVGDSLFLVARTYDVVTGRRLEVVSVEGPAGEDVRPLFDQLAARLLDLSGAPAEGRAPLAAVTTASLQAYRAYLQGLDALNHWRLAEASDALERAVALDSTFGLAHYRLAVARGWVSPADTLGQLAIRRAARHSERLPDRERGLIEAYRSFVEGDFDHSLGAYAGLVARDSADVEAWYGLADATFHAHYARRDVAGLQQSLRAFRRVVALDSGYALAYEHMGQLLTDAGAPTGWFTLVGIDSLRSTAGLDSARAAPARSHALREAVAAAQAWIRAQPATPRAYYHLYKALLASRRTAEARQVVAQLRSMYPDPVQPVFGFFDARAQLVGGDLPGAAETVRQALPRARAEAFARLDFGGEARAEVMTGANALAYLGDVDGAAEVIRLGRRISLALERAVDSTRLATDAEAWELSRLAELLNGVGAEPARLRAVWHRGATLARAARAEERSYRARGVASAALGVFLGPGADTTLLAELRELTGRPLPAPVEGLVALRRGDSAGARDLLAAAIALPAGTPRDPEPLDGGFGWGDLRPYAAEGLFQLGDFARVVEVLRDFGPARFGTRGFDARWAVLPRVRLLRGAALEQLGRRALAADEYRAVVQQWDGADVALLAVVRQARAGLARLEGTQG
jgi:eukaryotic-like serine/threonine-protein kinase